MHGDSDGRCVAGMDRILLQGAVFLFVKQLSARVSATVTNAQRKKA